MPKKLKCWTKEKNDGGKYTTCEGGDKKKKKIKFNVVERLEPIKKKIKFKVVERLDPIPTDNRQGLELMQKIPYIQRRGVEFNPNNIKYKMAEIPIMGLGMYRPTEPRADAIGEETEEEEEYPDEADDYREIIGMDEYGNIHDEHQGYDGAENLSDLLMATMNVERVLKRETRTIAYGDENDFDTEINQDRYDAILREFREEEDDEDEYPEDAGWDTSHAFDKSFYTERKDEDFAELRERMRKFKENLLETTPQFAEFLEGETEKHEKRIRGAWEREVEDHQITPFKIVKDIRMDAGGYGTHQEDPDEDMLFYDDESMDEYFNNWSRNLKNLSKNFYSKVAWIKREGGYDKPWLSEYVRRTYGADKPIKPAPMEEVD
tara:strand:+ start:84 stop:1214 length:1131 start_codon:yes stop_codon:yes gene_type:complete